MREEREREASDRGRGAEPRARLEAAPPEVVLRAEGVRVTYRGGGRRVEAVRGVDLEVRRGGCLGIAGESGSGKSTLMRAVLGLEEMSWGRVWFEGAEAPWKGRDFRRKAQMVFQDPAGSLNPRMTAGAAVGEALRVHGRARDRKEARDMAAEWLETVGLDAGYLERYPHEMSGGQRQRVNLARALCTGAEFLVADEPVSALDVSVQAQILNLLKRLQEERGITWVLIGHDLAVMRHMADEVVVMQKGLVVERGSAEEVLGSPAHEYTRALLAAVPDVGRALERRDGEESGVRNQESGGGGGNAEAQRRGEGEGGNFSHKEHKGEKEGKEG